MEKVRLLVLGTGSMGAQHVAHFRTHPAAEIAAGLDVDGDRLAAFTAEHGIPHGFTDLDAALASGTFDAVANVTPDAIHHATTLKCLAAGRPVFCEKPLAETHGDALEMTEAAEAAGLVNMVNLRYRTLPVMARAAEMVEAGDIGEVRHVSASYLQSWLVGSHWGDWKTEPRWLWRLSSAHGSKGALGDIGIHIVDLASFVAGAAPVSVHCRLATFPKAPGNRIGDYTLDANDSFVMSLGLEGGALGAVQATRYASGYANALKVQVFGTEGGLDAWIEQDVRTRSDMFGLRVSAGDDVDSQTWRDIDCAERPSLYHRFIEAVLTGRNDMPDFRRATQMQEVLDLCFVSDADGKTHGVESLGCK